MMEHCIAVKRSPSHLFEFDEKALAMDGAKVEDTL